MNFKERLGRFRSEASGNGTPDALVGPVPYQILWAVGVPLTPPFHQSFLGRLLTMGIPLGIAFGILMRVMPTQGEAPVPSIGGSIAMGVGFGVLMGLTWSGLTAFLKGRFNVPAWD